MEKYLLLEAAHIREAEKIIVRAVQFETFPQEIKSLEKNRPITLQSQLHPLAVELINRDQNKNKRSGRYHGKSETTAST